ncbi:unnamed protein product [Schistocephalus solidus]|uniref:Uncharacterized protein n=1 Tax=Schistocephalus solidus TaxID=70667 RepID=A0A183TIR9_SCHSO|nr:unnamed protein product [Schistocephalus solidus]
MTALERCDDSAQSLTWDAALAALDMFSSSPQRPLTPSPLVLHSIHYHPNWHPSSPTEPVEKVDAARVLPINLGCRDSFSSRLHVFRRPSLKRQSIDACSTNLVSMGQALSCCPSLSHQLVDVSKDRLVRLTPLLVPRNLRKQLLHVADTHLHGLPSFPPSSAAVPRRLKAYTQSATIRTTTS